MLSSKPFSIPSFRDSAFSPGICCFLSIVCDFSSCFLFLDLSFFGFFSFSYKSIKSLVFVYFFVFSLFFCINCVSSFVSRIFAREFLEQLHFSAFSLCFSWW